MFKNVHISVTEQAAEKRRLDQIAEEEKRVQDKQNEILNREEIDGQRKGTVLGCRSCEQPHKPITFVIFCQAIIVGQLFGSLLAVVRILSGSLQAVAR